MPLITPFILTGTFFRCPPVAVPVLQQEGQRKARPTVRCSMTSVTAATPTRRMRYRRLH